MGKDVKPSDSSEVIRWTVNRKKEVVLRMKRGEPIDALSRELGIEAYRLEKWHRKALQGIEAALKSLLKRYGLFIGDIVSPASKVRHEEPC